MSSQTHGQSLVLNQRKIPFSEISSGNYYANDDYEKGILDFSKKWLSGVESFSQLTSGSTGKPKTITLSREVMCHSISLTQKALNLKVGDHALVCLSADYIAGKMMLARALELNMNITVVSPSYFKDPNYATLEPQFIAIVPMQADLITSTSKGFDWLDGIDNVIIGGAPISLSLRNKLGSLKSANIFETYGMTETTSHVALKNVSEGATAFEAVSHTQFDTDEHGCLKIKSILTQNNWLQTNDSVNLLSPTQFEWLGRADFTINTGGIKIQPEILERKIQKYFSERNIQNRFFVAGQPDATLGQMVALFIEGPIDEDLDLNAILTGPEKPKRTVTINQFKETASGKIDRNGTILSELPSDNSVRV